LLGRQVADGEVRSVEESVAVELGVEAARKASADEERSLDRVGSVADVDHALPPSFLY
jgi:hypothetical protein